MILKDLKQKGLNTLEKALDEKTVKDLHAILTENIIIGGIYRSEYVKNV